MSPKGKIYGNKGVEVTVLFTITPTNPLDEFMLPIPESLDTVDLEILTFIAYSFLPGDYKSSTEL